jgi:hypothetical protein
MTSTTKTVTQKAAGAQFVAALTAPRAPRALIVTLDDNGQLQHRAISDGQSVVNLETELQDHLSASPRTTEWLLALRDYIDCRLAARAEAQATGGFCIPRQDGGWNIAHVNAFETLTAGGTAA